MSLIFVDGFDHYSSASDLKSKWGVVFSDFGMGINATAGRDGGGALAIPAAFGSFTYGVAKTLPAQTTYIVGARIKSPGVSTTGTKETFLAFQYSGTRHLALRMNSDATISVLRDSTVLATSTQALPTGAYQYLEFKATVSDTAGSYELRVNGQTWLSASGIDTQASAAAVINQLLLGQWAPPTGSGTIYYDDVYICDDQGATNNDFLGDVKIEAIYPTADGANTGLTPLSGTDHFAMVNQNPPDGDTTYNSSATLGAKDTYGFSDIPVNGDSILGVQVLADCRKENAGARGVKLLTRPGTTDHESPVGPVSVDYGYQSHLWETNPDTGAAWTEGEVNAAEFGLEVSA